MNRRFIDALTFLAVILALNANTVMGQEDEGSADVSDLLQEAGGHLQNQEWAEAADVFEQILKHDTENGQAWHLLGYSLHMDGKLDAAIKAHSRATEFDDYKPIALYNLCCAYSLKGENERSLKFLKKAFLAGFEDFEIISEDSDLDNIREEDAFEKLVAAAEAGELAGDHEDEHEGNHEEKHDGEEHEGEAEISGDVEEMMMKGNRLLAEGEFLKAAELYHEAVESAPDFGAGWFQLGYALHAGGELDKAIKVHQKAAKFEEFSGIATYNLGCAYALQNKTDDAFECLNKAAKLGFTDVEQFENDSDLEGLHEDERFEKLIARVEELAEKMDAEDKEKKKEKAKNKDGKSDF